MPSFEHTANRLKAIRDIEVLQDGPSMIAVSPAYQGRVFTSTANGLKGRSYGWINWELIDNQEHITNIAYLGGESRLWFGPERGKFSFFFPKGKPQIDEFMSLPPDMNRKTFEVVQRTDRSITVQGDMKLRNASDFVFELGIERTVRLLTRPEIEQSLSIRLNGQIQHVGFSAETHVTNHGYKAFSRDSGLVAIWELGCMLTTPDNIVIIPLSDPNGIVNSYFNPVGDRMKIADGVVYYRADALGMNKIGIPPSYCTDIMGSYSPSANQLNIVTFSFDQDSLYVNSIPDHTDPYGGDVVNIFNGEVNDKMNWNFPFYEFESSSSARELDPNEKVVHTQTTYHFEGKLMDLDRIAQEVLGISLEELPSL